RAPRVLLVRSGSVGRRRGVDLRQKGVLVDATRRTALVAGGFYLITFISSIPAVFLLDPVLNDSNYIVSSGADTRVLWGCFLDLVNAIACIGTAVTLFPVV